jgi:hypothetical protein
MGVRKALLLLALGLAACNLQGLPGSGEEGGFQLLNADELRMTIRYGDGTPFEGRLRVLEAEAPVVGGKVYLPLRTQSPQAPDPYDLLCLGGGAFYVDLSPTAPSPRGGLYRADGSQARLLMYPKTLPYRAPDYLWYLVHVEEAVVKGGLQECPYLPRAAQYDLELSPGWNLVYYEPEDPGIHRAWVYGRKEAYWKVWAR